MWLDARHIWTTRPTRNVNWKWLGPFTVVCRVSPYAYELELFGSIQIHRAQSVPHFDPVVDDPLEGQRNNLPPPVEVEGEEEYQASGVEDSRMYRNQLQYLILCTGYVSLRWEPAKFVDGL